MRTKVFWRYPAGEGRKYCRVEITRIYCICKQYSEFITMDDIRQPLPVNPVRLMDQLRKEIRQRGMSYQTEKTYLYWVRYYIRFHNKQHPSTMGAAEIDTFLSYLSERRNVSVNTQRIALNAIIFLYKKGDSNSHDVFWF